MNHTNDKISSYVFNSVVGYTVNDNNQEYTVVDNFIGGRGGGGGGRPMGGGGGRPMGGGGGRPMGGAPMGGPGGGRPMGGAPMGGPGGGRPMGGAPMGGPGGGRPMSGGAPMGGARPIGASMPTPLRERPLKPEPQQRPMGGSSRPTFGIRRPTQRPRPIHPPNHRKRPHHHPRHWRRKPVVVNNNYYDDYWYDYPDNWRWWNAVPFYNYFYEEPSYEMNKKEEEEQ